MPRALATATPQPRAAAADAGFVVGIDARAASEVPAGRGRVMRELLPALARTGGPHRYRLYCRTPHPGLALDARFSWHVLAGPDGIWHARCAAAANRSCDVFLSSNSYLTPWFLAIPVLSVVYDLVPFVPGARAQRRAALIERLTIRRGLARSARIWCISNATRTDLLERRPGLASRAVTIPLAASEAFAAPIDAAAGEAVRQQYRLPERFLLSVGTLEPRKNLRRLVAAYRTLDPAVRKNVPLALVGPRGWELDAALGSLESASDVRVLGHVSEEDLVRLYATCEVFCYPSLYEGFGLPVLEAMTAGAPVITSSVSSLPEVGGDAVTYADPRDEAAIATALARLLSRPEERTARVAAGRRKAREFSWDRTAREVVELLEAAIQDPRRPSYAAARRWPTAGRL